MAIEQRYEAHSVSLHNATGSLQLLDGVTNLATPLQPEQRAEQTGSTIDARHASVVRVAPMLRGTSVSLARALAILGIHGVEIEDGATEDGLLAYLAKKQGPEFAAGAVHRSYQFHRGVLIPRTLNVEHRGDAGIDFEAYGVQKDANDPVTVSDAAALPDLSGLAAERFGIGPIQLGGNTIEGVRTLTIDFGLDASTEGMDSAIFDSIATVNSANDMSITIVGLNPLWLDGAQATQLPIEGIACEHSNSEIYLRRRKSGGTFSDDANPDHIKFTIAGVANVESAGDGNVGEGQTARITIRLNRDDSDNDPITMDLASAIA